MKKLFLIILLISSLSVLAQKSEDVVFLKDGEVIKNCRIREIEKTIVSYYYMNSYYKKEARAYVRGGLFYSLETENLFFKTQLAHLPDSIKELNYKGRSYDFYYKKHHQATVRRNMGIGFTAGAVLSFSYAYVLLKNDHEHVEEYFTTNGYYAIGLVTLGITSAGFGIPMLIVGQTQQSYYKKKLNKMFQNDFSVSAGITPNGVGLVLRF